MAEYVTPSMDTVMSGIEVNIEHPSLQIDRKSKSMQGLKLSPEWCVGRHGVALKPQCEKRNCWLI